MARQLTEELGQTLVEQEAAEVIVGGVLVADGVAQHEPIVAVGGVDARAAIGSQMEADVLGREALEGGGVGNVEETL